MGIRRVQRLVGGKHSSVYLLIWKGKIYIVGIKRGQNKSCVFLFDIFTYYDDDSFFTTLPGLLYVSPTEEVTLSIHSFRSESHGR